MVIVYKALVSLTSVFKHCYSPDLEKADFDRQSFQYISKNYYLRPERRVHLTHGTLRTQTDVLDATSD